MINKIINKFKNSAIAKNSIWMIATTVAHMIISLFLNMVVARYLGVTNYGILNYGISFINFFSGICTLGLGTITIKYLVNEKENHGQIIGTCILMRLVSSFISIILITTLVFILKGNEQLILISTFLQSLTLIFDSFNTINLWYQYKLQSKYTAIISFISYIFVVIYKLILVFSKKSIVWFAFSNCLSSVIIAILLVFTYFKNGGASFKICISKGKEMLKQSYHFIISSLMVAIYAQTDKIMIGSMIDDIAAVGLYSVSTTIVSLWSFLPTAIIDSFKSSLLEMKKVSYEKYILRLKQLYSIIIWLSILYTIFIFVFGKYIILILYGSEYLGGLASLKVVIFSVMFSFVGVIREFWLVCEGKQKYAKWFALTGIIFNVVLNSVLIPTMGIVGAAIATAITQFATGVIAPLLFKDTKEAVKHFICGLIFKYN